MQPREDKALGGQTNCKLIHFALRGNQRFPSVLQGHIRIQDQRVWKRGGHQQRWIQFLHPFRRRKRMPERRTVALRREIFLHREGKRRKGRGNPPLSICPPLGTLPKSIRFLMARGLTGKGKNLKDFLEERLRKISECLCLLECRPW